MASDALFAALAEALSRPSKAYRAADAALGIPKKALEGYVSGSDIAEKFRKRKIGQETLRDVLGANVPERFSKVADIPQERVAGFGGLRHLADDNNDPFMDALKKDYIQARIESLRNPKPPKPVNPLDDELKQARIDALKKGSGSDKSVQNAYELYSQAKKGLERSLSKTTTGPIFGRLPAFTANQQAADSSVAAMAPVLKQLFRVAGEGVFTDRDQELLLRMVTNRTIRPEARGEILQNVDNIVRAKLGMGADSPSFGGTQVKSFNTPEEAEASGYKGPAVINGKRAIIH